MARFLSLTWSCAAPLLLVAAGCSFFTLEEPDADDDDDGGPSSGGSASGTGGTPPTSGTGGSGGSTAGSSAGGTSGASSGAGGAGGSAGGGAGGAASGGGGAAGSASGGDAGSATAGTSGADAGGTGGAGTSGSGGAGGTGGGAGSAGNGGTGSPPDACDDINASAEEFAGHCYLVNTTPVAWPAARDACMALGGHLVTISSEGVTQTEFDAENAFVWGLVDNMEVWLGLTDGKQDSEAGDMTPFAWVTGEAITIHAWSDAEPNNYQKECTVGGGGTCYEHCGFIPSDRNGQWNDDVCAYEKPYVCEWELAE
jgi:hypothetical protein